MTTTETVGVHGGRPPSPEPGRGRRSLVTVMSRLGQWRAWLLTAVFYLGFAGVFFGTSAPFSIPRVEAACGQPPPDVQFAGGQGVDAFLRACGPAGRDAYQALQTADLLYPMVFALFLASSLALALRHLAPGRPGLLRLAALPFLASAFDYLENAFAWRALMAFPASTSTDHLLDLASAAKVVTSWAAGLLLIGVLVALVLTKARRQPNHDEASA